MTTDACPTLFLKTTLFCKRGKEWLILNLVRFAFITTTLARAHRLLRLLRRMQLQPTWFPSPCN